MKRMKKILTGLLTLAMTLSMMTMTAFAAEPPAKMPTIDFDSSKKGSITIHKYEYNGEAKVTGTGEDNQTPPEGAEPLANVKFKITKIAELSAYYGTDAEAFPTVEAAKGMAAIATFEKATGSDGVATFNELPLGLYLVQETEAPAQITGKVGDFLVSVPMTNADGDDWLYNVHVYPKNSSTYGEVTLQKKGKIGSADATNLKGAQFKLEVQKNPTTWEQVLKNNKGADIGVAGILTTGSDGKITVKDLAPGDYRFVEVKVPENTGYIADLKTAYRFTVAEKDSPDDGATYKAGSILIDGEKVDTAQHPIEVINYKPAVEKEVQIKAGGWKNASADYSVGDTIPYRVTVDVPANIADLKTFTLTDTPTNQEYQTGTLKIYSDSSLATETLVGEYTVTSENSGWKITFDPKDLSSVAGERIYISFKMTLKEGAIVGSTGNTNKINLDYSNKILPDGTPDPGTPETDKIENETTVYTFGIAVKKEDASDGKALQGVTFDLYRKLEVGEDTTGSVPNPVKGLAGNYIKVNREALETNSEGKISVPGLAKGDYWLVETKTIDNYNLLKAPINVPITATYSETKKTETITDSTTGKTTTTTIIETKTLTNAGEAGVFTTTVKNSKGFTLPTTGGIGTFVFTFAGIAMMAAAVILLITSKKKKAE